MNEEANSQLTTDKFVSFLTSNQQDDKERQAYLHLIRFVKESECLTGKKNNIEIYQTFSLHIYSRK